MSTDRRSFLKAGLRGMAGFTIAGAGLPDPAALRTWAATPHGDGGPTAFVHATVIDGTDGPPQRDTTVVLIGRRILAVGPDRRVPVPPGARVIDATGRFLIPGLWDMHVHSGVGADLEQAHLPLYLANGVTGIREMWGFADHHQARDRIRRGELAGPRWVIASSLVDGPDSIWARFGATIVTDDAQARAAVRRAREDRADFVKVYSFLGRDTYAAIVDEASRLHLPFAGHLPDRVAATMASDAGQLSFEHLLDLFIATSTEEEELRRRLDALAVDPARPLDFVRAVSALDRQAVGSHDPGKAAALYRRFAANGTWQCPTLSILRVLASPAGTFSHDPRLRYVTAATRAAWQRAADAAAPPPAQAAQSRLYYEAKLRLVGAMASAGVGILAGTDSANPYVIHGFSLHDELELLVGAGLSPLRALQAATRDAARFLGLGHETGTITPGRSADLVLLDADPLADIGNTRRIHAVVHAGRVITAAGREAILAGVERYVSSVPTAAPAVAGCACFHEAAAGDADGL